MRQLACVSLLLWGAQRYGWASWMLTEDQCWKTLKQTVWSWGTTPMKWEKRDPISWERLMNNLSSTCVRWLHFLLWNSVTVFTFPLDFRELTCMLASWEECGNLPDCPLKQFFLVAGSGLGQVKSDTLLKWSTPSISRTFISFLIKNSRFSRHRMKNPYCSHCRSFIKNFGYTEWTSWYPLILFQKLIFKQIWDGVIRYVIEGKE